MHVCVCVFLSHILERAFGDLIFALRQHCLSGSSWDRSQQHLLAGIYFVAIANGARMWQRRGGVAVSGSLLHKQLVQLL